MINFEIGKKPLIFWSNGENNGTFSKYNTSEDSDELTFDEDTVVNMFGSNEEEDDDEFAFDDDIQEESHSEVSTQSHNQPIITNTMEEEQRVSISEQVNAQDKKIAETTNKLLTLDEESILTANSVAEAVLVVKDKTNTDINEIRREIFDSVLKDVAKESGGQSLTSLLFSPSPEDTIYNSLIGELYPNVKNKVEIISERVQDKGQYNLLVETLILALSKFIWTYLLQKANPVNYTAMLYQSNNIVNMPEEVKNTGVLNEEGNIAVLLKNNIFTLVNGVNQLEVKEVEEVKEAPKKKLSFEEQMIQDMIDEKTETVFGEIRAVLEPIYQSCTVEKPMGVLTTRGVLCVHEGNVVFNPVVKVLTDQIMHQIWTLYVDNNNNYFVREPDEITSEVNLNYFDTEGNLKVSYIPLLHLYNINNMYVGQDGNLVHEPDTTKFRRIMWQDIKSKIRSLIELMLKTNCDERLLEMSIKKLFTTIFIIREADRRKVFYMTYYLNTTRLKNIAYRQTNHPYYLPENKTENSKLGDLALILEKYQKEIFNSEVGQVLNSSVKGNLVNFIYAFDAKKYASELLFAYKVFDKIRESNGRIAESKVILGRKLDGTPFELAFDNQKTLSVSIIAGSRSGKGVATMNPVATLIGCGSPLIYCDNKPDMAGAFWHLEKKYNTRFLAIDAEADCTANGKTANRIYNWKSTIPQSLESIETFNVEKLRILGYLKTMILYLAYIRKRSVDGVKDGKKFYAVFDELQSYTGLVGDLWQTISNLKIDTPRGAKNYDEDVVKYLQKILSLLTSVKIELADFYQKTAGIGYGTAIVLGQSVNPDDWRFGEKGWRESPFIRLIVTPSFRMLGANHFTSGSAYSIEKCEYEGKSFISGNNMGYFAVHSGSKAPERNNDLTVIKSYFVLNENDVEKGVVNGDITNLNKNSNTGGFLGNFGDLTERNDIYNNELLNSDGTVNKAVGFDGLIEKTTALANGLDENDPRVAELVAKNLAKGYDMLYEYMQEVGLGKYESIEEYLYDFSYDALHTVREICNKKPLTNMEEDDRLPAGYSYGTVDVIEKDEEGNDIIVDTAYGLIDPNGNLVENEAEFIDQWRKNNPPNGLEDTLNGDSLGEGVLPFTATTEEKPVELVTSTQQPSLSSNNTSLPSIDVAEPVRDISPILGEGVGHQYPPETPNVISTNDNAISNMGSSTPDISLFSKPSIESEVVTSGINTPEHNFEMKMSRQLFNSRKKGDELSYLNTLSKTSDILLAEINKALGGLDRVTVLEITKGKIFVNGYKLNPSLSQEVLDVMPPLVSQSVINGATIELFHAKHIKKFPNLVRLVMDKEYAEYRFRDEFLFHPTKDWNGLFSKLPRLQELVISGTVYTRGYAENNVTTEGVEASNFYDDVQRKVSGLSRFTRPVNNFVNRKTPLRVMKNAGIATAATYGVVTIATIFGGWGLLFGAFAGYGALKSARQNNNNREN